MIIIKLSKYDSIPINFTGIVEYFDGTERWYKNGRYHREDGPAVVQSDGTKEWFQNGQHHREGGPAIEFSNGTKYWFLNGKVHREDGPAVEFFNRKKEWYIKGKKISEISFKVFRLCLGKGK